MKKSSVLFAVSLVFILAAGYFCYSAFTNDDKYMEKDRTGSPPAASQPIITTPLPTTASPAPTATKTTAATPTPAAHNDAASFDKKNEAVWKSQKKARSFEFEASLPPKFDFKKDYQKIRSKTESLDHDFKVLYRYDTPAGFPMLSADKKCDVKKLKDYYKTLANTRHGWELSSLWVVLIYPPKTQIGALGLYYNERKMNAQVGIAFKYRGLIDGSILFFDNKGVGEILMYNSKPNVIVHEYGHHFAYANGGQDAPEILSRQDLTKEQAKIINGRDVYNAEHDWRPWEIAAEDFVLLNGPKSLFLNSGYPEVKRKIDLKINRNSVNHYFPSLLYPYLKNGLKLPAESVSLRDRFYSFLMDPPPIPPIPKVRPAISMKKQGNNTVISWTKPWKSHDMYYLLACKFKDQWGMAGYTVCARRGDENSTVTIGKVTVCMDGGQYSTRYVKPAKGQISFIVFAVFPNSNTIYMSAPVQYSPK